MADSDYYKRLVEQYEREIGEYEESIAALLKIAKSLSSDFGDRQRQVNREIEDLHRNLIRAVRHDSRFLTAAEKCCGGRQEAVSVDGTLKEAAAALENELAELNRKKALAGQNRDSCQRSYLNAKEAERRAALEALRIQLQNSAAANLNGGVR